MTHIQSIITAYHSMTGAVSRGNRLQEIGDGGHTKPSPIFILL